MKKIIFIVPALSLLFFNACTQTSNSGSSGTGLTAATVKNIASDGKWHVSYFFDNANETSAFSGYDFTFGNSGDLSAIRLTDTVTGSWNTGGDNISTTFGLNFLNGMGPFAAISNGWGVISANSVEIKLADVTGGKTDTDYLTFTKN